jgi:hypothetical protein
VSAVLLSLLLAGCGSDADTAPAAAGGEAPNASLERTTPPPSPSPSAAPADAALASVEIGPDDVRLVFDDGSETAFGYLDEPEALVAALTAELGEEPAVKGYAGDPDCGASTNYSYSPGLSVRRLDPVAGLQEPGEEGPLGFKVFADASTATAGATVRVTTTAGGELGASAEPVFATVPDSWIDAGNGARATVVQSSNLLGPVEDVDEDGAWRDRWGLAVTEEQGALDRIASPVGLAYFC